jgi:alcohol dehydrogenase YqhD (iron-dependent ADH family)
VGGGSVHDSAKAIVAGNFYDGDVWDLFIGKGTIEAALPVFDILTLAATVQPRFHSRMVEAIINTVIETTEILLVDPANYEARAEFAWAST